MKKFLMDQIRAEFKKNPAVTPKQLESITGASRGVCSNLLWRARNSVNGDGRPVQKLSKEVQAQPPKEAELVTERKEQDNVRRTA